MILPCLQVTGVASFIIRNVTGNAPPAPPAGMPTLAWVITALSPRAVAVCLNETLP